MQEKIYFTNSKGINLCGTLSNPTYSKEKPITILCHGFSTSKNGRTYVRLQEILNKHEISTFRFDFFGHGESGGNLEDITTSEAVDDILNAISFIKEQGYSRIALFGSSFGGMSSTITASKSDDLFVLALKSPVSDYEEVEIRRIGQEGIRRWKERGYIEFETFERRRLRLKYSFFDDLKNNNAYEAAKRIKIPTLIVHGKEDEVVPIEQSKKTANLIENCQLETIDGADHRYSNPEHFGKLVDLISEFIVENSKRYPLPF